MAIRPSLSKFSVNFKNKLKLWLRLKTKLAESTPPTSLHCPDNAQDEALYAVPPSKDWPICTATLDVNIWLKILVYCEVLDIIRVGMVCRSLSFASRDRLVWYHALLRITHDKRLPHYRVHFPSLSTSALRKKATLAARVDHAWHDPLFRPFRHVTRSLHVPASHAWSITLLPGGEWLVMLCRYGPDNYEGIMLCEANVTPNNRPRTVVLQCDHSWSSLRVFTSDTGDSLLLLRADHARMSTLGVCLVQVSASEPRMEMVFTTLIPQIEGCTAWGNYIAFGWTEPSPVSDHEPPDPLSRHMVRVMKLASSYREATGHCTVEVACKTRRRKPMFSSRRHSYGLRIHGPDRLIIVISNTALVAAYDIPPLLPVSHEHETVAVRPFWQFHCGHMTPRAVHLIPSVPAVDSPSAVIFYQNRCLFLAPDFDGDPPGLHPTYFGTYTSPRGLKRPLILGPHRAFWDLGRGRVGTRTLPTPLQPAFYHHHNGHWDLTGINVPEGDLADDMRPLTLVDDYEGRLTRAAWDEESGRLVVLPEGYREIGDGGMHVLVVDMIQ
ncbi:hypothetical protein F5I97DRAFT_1909620 [Phlebopus sp. FC_14]|nr:hypothetical protein F5I97DRAFT_1909620 [Phlebopus sp. FC_14]